MTQACCHFLYPIVLNPWCTYSLIIRNTCADLDSAALPILDTSYHLQTQLGNLYYASCTYLHHFIVISKTATLPQNGPYSCIRQLLTCTSIHLYHHGNGTTSSTSGSCAPSPTSARTARYPSTTRDDDGPKPTSQSSITSHPRRHPTYQRPILDPRGNDTK
jgi:hypothetical protein